MPIGVGRCGLPAHIPRTVLCRKPLQYSFSRTIVTDADPESADFMEETEVIQVKTTKTPNQLYWEDTRRLYGDVLPRKKSDQLLSKEGREKSVLARKQFRDAKLSFDETSALLYGPRVESCPEILKSEYKPAVNPNQGQRNRRTLPRTVTPAEMNENLLPFSKNSTVSPRDLQISHGSPVLGALENATVVVKSSRKTKIDTSRKPMRVVEDTDQDSVPSDNQSSKFPETNGTLFLCCTWNILNNVNTTCVFLKRHGFFMC